MKETLLRQYVKCGKKNCKSCPHGPYWYAYSWQAGKTRSRYVGKELPAGSYHRTAAPPATATPDWRDAIFNKETANFKMALQILGFERMPWKDELEKRYRELIGVHHPDRDGDANEAKYIIAAYSYLKANYVPA